MSLTKESLLCADHVAARSPRSPPYHRCLIRPWATLAYHRVLTPHPIAKQALLQPE